jgi:hypothetical protein
MGLKKMRLILRNIILLLCFFIIAFSYFSCSGQYSSLGGNCLDCLSDQPDSGFLVVNVTINNENPKVPMVIYRGKFNPDNIPLIEKVDTATSSPYKYFVQLDHTFSVKAEYKSGSKIIYAIDGSIFNTQKQSGCSNVCWQIIGGTLDARLKSY